jgi:hypothetical protein
MNLNIIYTKFCIIDIFSLGNGNHTITSEPFAAFLAGNRRIRSIRFETSA